jgi:glycosyltransferase involved in cell wall biosynthesis
VKEISVLNISSGDLVGSRFNGFDWHEDLKKFGINSKMLVGWNHNSKMDWVDSLSNREDGSFEKTRDKVFLKLALHDGIEYAKYPWSSKIFDHPWYKNADVIHLQIVHDGTLDLRTISRIIEEKPTVWTWHDPWPMTGHCIYPMDCKNWSIGCGNCPDLLRPFSVAKDRTRENRLEKRKAVGGNYILHVATEWFANLVESDSIATHPVPTVLPFGINDKWVTKLSRSDSRQALGISEDNFVIGLRSVTEPQKNLELVQSALKFLPIGTKLTILTIQNLGAFNGLKDVFEIVEIPWTNDNKTLAEFYSSLDLFVMPSRWETFGFMALEAMSYGAPVAALSGTAISEVCDIEENGYVISENSGSVLADIILRAIGDPDQVRHLGEKSMRFVSESRDYQKFLHGLCEIYLRSLEIR